MREKVLTMRLCGTAAGAIVFVLAAGCLVAAGGDTAAHDIAEKFAREAAKVDPQARRRADDEKRKADEHGRKASEDWRRVEEAEMLARARTEAEQRRLDMLQARAQAERADQQRKSDEELRQAEAVRQAEEQRRLAESRKAEEEARAAEALRQAEALQKAEEERRLAEVRKVEAEALVAEDARRLAEAQRRAEEDRIAEIRRAEEAARVTEARTAEALQRARLESEREAEAQRLAERLRSVREAREARATSDRAVMPTHDSGQPEEGSVVSVGLARYQLSSGETDLDVSAAVQRERRVTVLLLMQPGDRGIRRNNKSADPVLCGDHDCYVSNGPDSAASLLPARKALGFFRTWGRRAGACNNSLGCVFRGVDLDSLDGVLRPVDMRVVRHDRREAQDIDSASECRLARGRLACRSVIHAEDYVMWVVPESLAARAGPAALLQALDDGLPASERTASAPWPAR